MGLVNRPNNYTNGTPAEASEVNDDFDTLYNVVNGSLDQNNLADNAVVESKITNSAVTADKLASNAVTTGKINNDAVTPAKWTNPYCFGATNNANQTGIADATWTNVTLQTELFDTNNNFASSTYTAPVDGIYMFTGGGYVLDSNGGNAVAWLLFGLSVNDAATPSYYVGQNRLGSITFPDRLAAQGSTLISLNAGDTVRMMIYGNTSDSGNVDLQSAGCFFGGHLVHQTS